MSLLTVLWTAAIWWLGFFIIAKFLEFLSPSFFWRFIDRMHITTLKLGYIKWSITSLNHKFVEIGSTYRRFLHYWFTVGVIFGGVAVVLSVVALVLNLFWTLRTPSAKVQLLTPIIPGVNIPKSHLIYCFLALLIGGIFHEVGHALAAVITDRRINGFGAFLLFIYPGAFVDISSTDVNEEVNSKKEIFASLKIICAGGWHNITLALLAFLLMQCHHILVAPLFVVPERGLVVVDVQQVIITTCLKTFSFGNKPIKRK
jgi:S2P endopeptidase